MVRFPATALAITLAIAGVATALAWQDSRADRRRPVATKGLPPAFAPGGRTSALPGVILWTWERPEEFRFIESLRPTTATEPREVGVAFLAQTIFLILHCA